METLITQLQTKSRILLILALVAVQLAEMIVSGANDPQTTSISRTISESWKLDLLREKFLLPETNCPGWGNWDAPPFVIANPDLKPAKLSKGFSLATRSLLVHPGADREVAVGWMSPISGKVSVRAKVTCVDDTGSYPGGDGVSWVLAHYDRSGRQRVLAQGDLNRVSSVTIPLAGSEQWLAAIPFSPGDGLLLSINRRGGLEFDSSQIELIVSEVGAGERVWDLGKDVVSNLQSANPHADSQGNAAVWHLLAPRSDLSARLALDVPRETPGHKVESWTVASDDTQLVVGTTDKGQLCLYGLSHPADGWNWVEEPSIYPLPIPQSGGQGGWTFEKGVVTHTDGQQVVLHFAHQEPALELQSIWSAKAGGGPIRHQLRVTNHSKDPVELGSVASMFLQLADSPAAGPPMLWSFHTDGPKTDPQGVYKDVMQESFARQINTDPDIGLYIPYAVFDGQGKHGVYVGVEWSSCCIQAFGSSRPRPGFASVRAGTLETLRLAPGETLEAPPAFIGAYRGDVDDAGNSLRRYLFNHSMPEVVRKDASYPKVQWNAFGATGDKPNSWNCVEKKYYPLIDDIAPLGFEEVMIDVGWWKGETSAPEPESDPLDWPSGMAKAAAYAHQAGMRFGLYWNKGEDMASAEARARRMGHIKRLYNEYQADMWRSDCTAGPVVSPNYAAVRGFYAMLEELGREIPNFQWENCSGGGRIKDFGAMRHAVKIFMSDANNETSVRQEFYDGSYALPPAQLMGCVGYVAPQGPAGLKLAFRSTSMGAPEWFIDAPNGGNGGPKWSDADKAAVKAAVNTYKTKIRPLVRNADLYHILPCPDGRNWDGIQYYDPSTKKGVVYLFKPGPVEDTITLKLRGVEPDARYHVTFEDGTNPNTVKTGEELQQGIKITLQGSPVSELMFLEKIP